MQALGELGGLDILVNNASDLGPTPLALLGDTDCEDLERALATNLIGPFRLTKALLGALSASAREGRGAVVLNVSSDAAINAYPTWGAYSASKAALHHLSRIWDEELAAEGIRVLSVDPGDMDTPMHALAVPDADPATLKRPDVAAHELLEQIAAALPKRRPSGREPVRRHGRRRMIAADRPIQRPADGEAAHGRFGGTVRPRRARPLRRICSGPGDLIVANDAATLPASLQGVHVRTRRSD